MRKKNRPVLLVLTIFGLLSPIILSSLIFIALHRGWLNQDEIALVLSVVALMVAIYVAIFSGFISWKVLVFGALPRIDIIPEVSFVGNKISLVAGKFASLLFTLKNIGHWYAKPASTNTKLYVNVDPDFELKYVNYGSNLELREEEVRRGKRNGKYFIVKGIHLYYGEGNEQIELAVVAPNKPGEYELWITATSDQCDHGVFRFPITVKEPLKYQDK